MEAGSRYREATPVAALRSWIRSYYLLEDRGPGGAEAAVREGVMVPDGHLEVGFNLGGARLDRTGGVWMERPRACVDEVFDATRLICWHGPILYVAVKFHFEAGLELLDVDPSDVAVQPIDLGLLSLPGLRALEDDVACATTWDEIIASLDAFFLARLPDTAPDPLVAAAGARIRSAAGSVSVGDIAGALGVSRRTLELRTKERTGLTPKRIAQFVRTREAIRRVCAAPGTPLGRIAAGLGYCDQSHFNREFRATTGRTPGAFFAERQFVSELWKTTERPDEGAHAALSHSSNRGTTESGILCA